MRRNAWHVQRGKKWIWEQNDSERTEQVGWEWGGGEGEGRRQAGSNLPLQLNLSLTAALLTHVSQASHTEPQQEKKKHGTAATPPSDFKPSAALVSYKENIGDVFVTKANKRKLQGYKGRQRVQCHQCDILQHKPKTKKNNATLVSMKKLPQTQRGKKINTCVPCMLMFWAH